MNAPLAYHHARWMYKMLFVLKIAMFKHKFVKNLSRIRYLVLFYSIYSKVWSTSIFAAEAPL